MNVEAKREREQSDWSRAALLTVWNPRLFPETIETHVEALKTAPADRKWTWWGRIYQGRKSPEQLLEKWFWFEPLRAQAKERPLVLYATSFDALHALRIDRIQLERPPAGELPRYYEEKRVALWFRVRDVRALQWNSFAVADALAGLAPVEVEAPATGETGRLVRSAPSLDLYAAFENYWPIATEVVEPERIGAFDGAAGKAWHLEPGVSHPADIRQARAQLEVGDPRTWGELPDPAREGLAIARLLWENPRLLDLGAAPVAIALGRVLEVLGSEFCKSASKLLSQRGKADELHDRVHRDDRAWKGQKRDPTLGQLPFALPELLELLKNSGGPELTLEGSIAAIRQFNNHRNDAAHGRLVDERAVKLLQQRLWPELPRELVDATAQVRKLLR